MIIFQSVLAHEPLRVSLEDLHSAERKGKCWPIGAAWGGDPLKFTKTTGVSASNEVTADEMVWSSLLVSRREYGYTS